MANKRRYNTREFSYTRPIMYQGETYPSADSMISDEYGNKINGRIFADANGQYYTKDGNNNISPVMLQQEIPEVTITEPKINLLSKQFNDYLSSNNIKKSNYIEKNDATYVASPLNSLSIRPDLSFNAALKRSKKTYSNYSKALDTPFSEFKEFLVNQARYIKDHYIESLPTGASNCTLSATQWINPANPINKAASIVNNPSKYNYTKIDSTNALLGDLIIAKVPHKDSYHTMMITGFSKKNGNKEFRNKTYKVKKGEPLLTYSQGGNSLDNIQSNIPLSIYTANSDGHTENLYFRYIKPDSTLLLKNKK